MNHRIAFLISVFGLLSPPGLLSIERTEDPDEIDFCNVTCRIGHGETRPGRHLLCDLFQHDESCSARQMTPLTKEEREYLVSEHNHLRNNVARGFESRGSPGPQPAASNMMVLRWDEELEAVAKKLILECDAQPRTFCMDVPRFEVGDNSYHEEMTDQSKLLTSSFKAWVDEVDSLSLHDAIRPREYSLRDAPHYLQMVAGVTEAIGCAKAFADSPNGKNASEGFLACVYGPKGLKIDRSLYKEGPSCIACPANHQCGARWPGLCDNVVAREASVDVDDGDDVARNAQDAIHIHSEPCSGAAGLGDDQLSAVILATLLAASQPWTRKSRI